MTVRDLIVELLKHPMGAEVVMAKDAEGSDHSPWNAAKPGCYIAETTWSGEFYDTGRECLHPEGTCAKAVVLRPVN